MTQDKAQAAGAVSIDSDSHFSSLLGNMHPLSKQAVIAFADAHAAQHYEAGLAENREKALTFKREADALWKRVNESEASLARLVEGIEGLKRYFVSESVDDIYEHEHGNLVKRADVQALLPAKAEDASSFIAPNTLAYAKTLVQKEFATPAPAMGEELPQLREFEEWLNERRGYEVIEVFHEIVAKFRACMALRQPDCPADTQQGRDFDVEQSARAIESLGDAELAARLRHAWSSTAPVSQPAAQDCSLIDAVRALPTYTHGDGILYQRAADVREVAEQFTAPAPLSAPAGSEQEGDTKRLDFLETMVVNVRTNLRYGSRDLFWATPSDDDGDTGPSNIRAQIDAALAAQQEQSK